MSIETISFLAIWYVTVTAAATAVAWRYDRWITKAHDDDQVATRRVVPTSLLVVAGVAGVEMIKLLRFFPIAWSVANLLDVGVDGLVVALTSTGVLLVDSLIAYSAAGWPMVSGDLLREARARERAESIARERIREQSDELTLHNEATRLANAHGIDEAIEALEALR